MKRKRVVVLGATGSIGESALKVAQDIPERMEIVGLAANSKAKKLAAQANAIRPKAVCLVDESKIGELRGLLEYKPQIFSGENGLIEIACLDDAEMVLVAVVGTGGLRPALAAIEAGKNLAVILKRLEKLHEIKNYLGVAKGQLDLIENSFQLIADQIVTMQSPAELSGQLDDLLDGVESIRQTAVDTEKILHAIEA